MRNWETGRRRVPYAVDRLLRILRNGELPGEAWAGYRLWGDTLWTPEGHTIKAQEAAWLSQLVRLANAYTRERRQPRPSVGSDVESATDVADGASATERTATDRAVAPIRHYHSLTHFRRSRMRAPKQTALKRTRANFRTESDNAVLYLRLSDIETNPRIARIYRRIADSEQANAEFWLRRLRELDAEATVPYAPSLRTRALIWLASKFGAEFVMPTVIHLAHADQVNETAVDAPEPLLPRSGATGRSRHDYGNTLRAAVLGANDGLVSNISLVMGVAGAGTSDRAILITGLAGLVAGACSMAMGEWLSVNSSRDFYRAQIKTRAELLAVAPEEAILHLAHLYETKGLEPAEASQLASRLSGNSEAILDTLVREELGVDPRTLGGSAWHAAISSFCLFAIGAFFPVAPYAFLHGSVATGGSIVATAFALSLIGIGTALFTGNGLVFSVVRQLTITSAAAGVTFAIGRLVGAVLAG